MNGKSHKCSLLFLVCLFFTMTCPDTTTATQSLSDEYKPLQAQVAAFTEESINYDELRKIEAGELSTEKDRYSNCQDLDRRRDIDPLIQDANLALRDLEDQNKLLKSLDINLDNRSEELETQRKKIESSYPVKKLPYDSAFRQHMAELVVYINRVKDKLFPLKEEYANGAKSYRLAVGVANQFCYGIEDFDAASLQIVKYIDEINRAVLDLKKGLREK